MEDDQKVIAKIPHSNAGPPVLTTASEVASMEYARTVQGLPVPKVLAWSAMDQNPVDAEYLIMEEAQGSQLHEVWQDLPLRAKVDIIHEIVDIEKKLFSVSFDKIGSLYLKESDIPGCEPAGVTTGPQEARELIRSRFSIGPIARREFWKKERSKMHQYHGPWKTATDYLQSLARREIDWIKAYGDPKRAINYPFQFTSADQHSAEAHIACLRKFISAIPHIIPKDPELCPPRFWHPFLHAGNIYVDEQCRISSIVDWQGAWIAPPFIGASPPKLLDYGVDMLMKLPDNFKELDEAIKEELRYQVSQSILIDGYERSTAKQNPLMNKVMRHPHGQTLKQLEAFAGRTWDDCLIIFKECLIRTQR
jgi:hypothetical protein